MQLTTWRLLSASWPEHLVLSFDLASPDHQIWTVASLRLFVTRALKYGRGVLDHERPDGGSMIHIVRNALDHGLETEDDRIQAGKSAVGNLSLEAGKDEDSFWIQIKDDGRGIDFTRIAARARAAGLPHETRSDLVTALLTDGISTRSTVTELSGRGVGTSAVKEAVDKLGGRIDLESSPGSGTSWRFVLPLSSLATMGLIS